MALQEARCIFKSIHRICHHLIGCYKNMQLHKCKHSTMKYKFSEVRIRRNIDDSENRWMKVFSAPVHSPYWPIHRPNAAFTLVRGPIPLLTGGSRNFGGHIMWRIQTFNYGGKFNLLLNMPCCFFV